MNGLFSRPVAWGLLALPMLLALASPLAAQTIAGGSGHTVILKPDGTVWTFGYNNNGQIGDNTLPSRTARRPFRSVA